MKWLLFSLLLALSTATVLRLPDPVQSVLRVTSRIHHSSRISLSPSSRQGLNFDACTTEVGCDPPRDCILSEPPPEDDDDDDNGDNDDDDDDDDDGDDGDGVDADSRLAIRQTAPQAQCQPGRSCQCVPTVPPFCEVSDDCDDGESCVSAPGPSSNVCMSDCVLVNSAGNPGFPFEVVDGPNPTECLRDPVTPPPTTTTGTTTAATSTAATTSTNTVVTTTTTTTTAVPTTTAPTTTDDDDGVCFPGSSIVHLANRKKIRMDELQAGHDVQHDTLGTSSKIFLFTHKTKDAHSWFYQLTTESGHSITLTGNHYIYADDRLTTADSVKRGDKLRTVHGDSAVTRIRRVEGHGLYAPHSLHGDLVIDGIVVSGYSRAVNPSLAHALLAPVRWFVSKTGVAEPLGGLFYSGGRGVEKIMLRGADKY